MKGIRNWPKSKLKSKLNSLEIYIGGEKVGLRGRGAAGKVIVVGAAEIRSRAVSRIRLRVISDVNGDTLINFIKNNVASGSTIVTDDWKGYSRLKHSGYKHIVNSAGLGNLHKIFGNLKQWLIGTHKGVSPQHMQAYLNEFVFRVNRKVTPMAAFQTVLGLGAKHKGPTYKGLFSVAKYREPAWVHPTNPQAKRGKK